MSIEKNKEIVRRAIHAQNQENWAELIGEFSPSPAHTEAFIEQHSLFRNAFTDYHCTIKEMVAEGDKVIIYCTVKATHSDYFPFGELRDIPPTGRTLEWDEVSMWQLENGKLVTDSGWLMVDRVSRLQQMGMLAASV